MSRHKVLGLLAFLLLALVSALAVLPARWLVAAIPASWPVAVVDARGTIWNGDAALAIGPAHNRRRLPDPVSWHWSIRHGPRLEIRHPWLSGPMVAALTPAGLSLSAQTFTLPAKLLSAVDARLAAIGPDGRLTLRWPALRLTGAPPAGTRLLEAEWRDASSALAPIRPLGHYSLTLTADGPGSTVKLDTRQGPLLLEGSGALKVPGGLDFTGTARVDPAAGPVVQAALQDVLGALGPRKNNVTQLRMR